jgi:hypothetical protein
MNPRYSHLLWIMYGIKICRKFALGGLLPIMALMGLNVAALAYTMPKGVPNAWVDPAVAAPPRPAAWTIEQVGYYYVDWNKGTDSGRTYGTPTAPRKTIPNPARVGSRIELAPGIYGGGTLSSGLYTGAPETDLSVAGTSGAWVAGSSGPAWLVGAANLGSVMSGSMIIHGSYLYIDGIKWAPSKYYRLQIGSGGVNYASDHIMIRNCEMDGGGASGSYGMIVGGKVGYVVQNIIIYNNNIHGYGNMAATVDEDNNVFATGDYCFDLWFISNICHTCTAGIRAGSAGGAAGPETCMRLYIAGNDVYNILQSGIWVKYSQDVVFSSNHVHGIIDTPWSPSKCMGAQYAPKGLWIIYNRLEAGRYGVAIFSTEGDGVKETWPVYIIGNIITGARQPSGTYSSTGGYGNCAIGIWGSTERYVIGNTLYDNCAGIMSPGNIASSKTKIVNNIISEVTESGIGSANGKHICIAEGASSENTTIDYNLYHQTGGEAQIRWNGGGYNLTSFRTATAEGDHDREGDPSFVDTSKKLFSLKLGSPAIDAGSSDLFSSLAIKYQSTFGVSMLKDFADNARQIGAGIDIGAYEFSDSAGTNAPIPPKNFRVVPTPK